MRTHSFRRIGCPLAAGLFSLVLTTTAGAQTAATIDACFVPASGTLYRIDTPSSPAPGAPKNCLSPLHTRQTWSQQGPAGVAGPVGPQGAVGSAGELGPVGPAGPSGAPGSVGPGGPSGTPGSAGPSGAVGPGGSAGAAGPQGLSGPNGKDGLPGQDGAAGPAGPQGVAGAEGLQGPIGKEGLQGKNGKEGPVGLTGAAGAVGPVGAQGSLGPQGPSGTSNAKMYFAGQSGTAPGSGRQVNPVANCPTGQFALGGGVMVLTVSGGSPVLLQSRPEMTAGRPTGWRVIMNVGAGNFNIQSQVICAP